MSDTAPRGLPEESARRRQGWRTLGQGAEHRVRLADHWRCALGRPARLVVVCPDTVEADRVQTDQLVRDRQPHLVVTADAERASVGPLVIPGSTPCLRCHDLQRRATEPRWGDFVAELGRTRSIPAPFVRQWAAATAAAQVHAFAAGCVPDSAGGTVELSAGSGVLRARSWPRHPDCGCGAPW